MKKQKDMKMNTKIEQNDLGQLFEDQIELLDRFRTYIHLDDAEGMNVPDFAILAQLIVDMALFTEIGSVDEIQAEIVRTHVTAVDLLNEEMRNQETASSNHEQNPNTKRELAN